LSVPWPPRRPMFFLFSFSSASPTSFAMSRQRVPIPSSSSALPPFTSSTFVLSRF
jgi:hypothetical protein